MKPRLHLCLLAVALTSCGQQREPQEQARNATVPVVPAPTVRPPVAKTQALPPKPPATQRAVDPKSTSAAIELVQSFVTLLNQRKFDEAYMLLGPNAPPRSAFDRTWQQTDKLHVIVGKAGDQEGAAGSIYLSIPLIVSRSTDGQRAGRSPTAILRRVNDVPGSTEAQRHWHIERIDWGSRD